MDNIQDFLNLLFRPGEIINFRMINSGREALNEFIPNSADLSVGISELVDKYQPNCSIFFGVHPRAGGSETKMVSRASTVFVDIDEKQFSDSGAFSCHLKNLNDSLGELGLPPSITVSSGHGVHLYWILKRSFRIEEDETGVQLSSGWNELQKALIVFCNGDKSIHDLPRVMRLPGSLNVKDPSDKKPCEIIEITSRFYSISDFKKILDTYRASKKREDKNIEQSYSKDCKLLDVTQMKGLLVDVLSQTPGVCDSYEDFIRLSLALKSAGLDYESVDPIFSKSNGYDQDKNRRIYSKLTPKKVGIGTVYHFAAKHNSDLLRKKLREQGYRPNPTRISDNLEPKGDTKPSRRKVVCDGGSLDHAIVEAGKILFESGILYQRMGEVVKVTWTEDPDRRLVPVIVPVKVPFLTRKLTALADWVKYDVRKDDYRYIDCPKQIAECYLDEGQWDLPFLLGVIDTPTLRPDGTILDQEGYDKQTGLLLDFKGKERISIPERPTRKDAQLALCTIRDLVKLFPFCSDVDLSVFIAAVLTAVVRRSIRVAPLFCFSAPKMASGKSILADLIAIIATGSDASKFNQQRNSEEERKALLSLLMSGGSVMCMDNIDHPVESSPLCTIISETQWQERILGVNKIPNVSTRVTWLATGNNLRLKGDLTTRALICRLDPKCERPEERSFPFKPRTRASHMRGKMVSAALTIMRAFIVSGDDVDVVNFARFEEWSDMIRKSLVWLGMPDPCLSRRQLEEEDPDRERLTDLLSSWFDCFQAAPKSIKEAKQAYESGTGVSEAEQRLFESFMAISGKNGQVNDKRLSYYFRHNKERIEGGFQLLTKGRVATGMQWVVLPVFNESLLEKGKQMIDEGKTENQITSELGISRSAWFHFLHKISERNGDAKNKV